MISTVILTASVYNCISIIYRLVLTHRQLRALAATRWSWST